MVPVIIRSDLPQMNDGAPETKLSTEITRMNGGRVLRYQLLFGGEPLSWSGVIDRWQNDRSFRQFFIALLVDAPFATYFWETPPVTRSVVSRQFEFVFVNGPQLVGIRSDQYAFANHFAAAKEGMSVIEFSSLGGDATLVVPCPGQPVSAYSQISEFSRNASDDQQHQLWGKVGTVLERQIGVEPVWLSTSGLGVYWLHVRFDSTPKYYTHEPYRNR
jgi:hypothetical protein